MAGFRNIGVPGDRERAGVVGHHVEGEVGRVGEKLAGQDDAADRDRTDPVERGEGDGSGRGFGIAVEFGTFGFAVARAGGRGQLVFFHHGRVFAGGNVGDDRRCVADFDRQRGIAGRAVSVQDRIVENVDDVARRFEIPLVGIVALRIDGQFAVLADEDLTRLDRAIGVRIAGDRTSGAIAVGTRLVVDKDIAADFREGSPGDLVDVVTGDRVIVDHVDLQVGGRAVAIDIDDRHHEGAVDGFADQIVGQREEEADLARADIDAGDGQETIVAGDGAVEREGRFAILDDVDAIHAHDIDAIGRAETDGADRDFRIGLVARAGGFVDAVDRAGRQAVFIDGCNGIDRASRVVGRFDHDDRVFFDTVGNDLALFGLRELEFGVGQQVADGVGSLDIARIDFEIATRALRVAGSGLGLVARQQRGEVGGRDGHAVDDDLRDDDGAFGNDDARAVFHDDDEVATLDGQVVERGTLGQDHEAIGIGLQDHDAVARLDSRCTARLAAGTLGLACHVAGVAVGEIIAGIEAVHVVRPCFAGLERRAFRLRTGDGSRTRLIGPVIYRCRGPPLTDRSSVLSRGPDDFVLAPTNRVGKEVCRCTERNHRTAQDAI